MHQNIDNLIIVYSTTVTECKFGEDIFYKCVSRQAAIVFALYVVLFA